MAAIKILVNGEACDIDLRSNVSALLERLSLPERRIAVELNGRVVSRTDWPQAVLQEGDRVEVVHFVGGG
jgi:sulfur carrier protein